MTRASGQAGSIAAATLVTGLVLYSLWRLLAGPAETAEIWSAVRGLEGSGLLWLIAAGLFNLAVYQLPFMASTAGLRYFPAFVVRQTAFAFTNAVPGGGTIGLGLQYAMLKSYNISSAATAGTVAIGTVWATFMALAMPVVALVGLLLAGRDARSLAPAALAGVLGIAVLIGAFVLVLNSERHAIGVIRPFGAALNALLKSLRRPRVDAARKVLAFRRQVVGVVGRRWKAITLSNLLVQLGMFFVLLAALVGTGQKIGVFEVFAAFGFSRLGTLVPLTPGGIGTTDALLASVLNHYGVRLDAAIAAIVLWRAVFYLPQVVLGLSAYVYWQAMVALRPGSSAHGLWGRKP